MTALRSAALAYLCWGVLCWGVLLALTPAGRPADLPPSGALAPEEQEFVGRVNAERAGRSLPVLAVDALLTATARAHCGEMDARGYFGHRSPAP